MYSDLDQAAASCQSGAWQHLFLDRLKKHPCSESSPVQRASWRCHLCGRRRKCRKEVVIWGFGYNRSTLRGLRGFSSQMTEEEKEKGLQMYTGPEYWALLYEGESGHWVRDFIITLSDLNCIMRFVTTKSSCTTIFATRLCIKSSSQFLWKCLMRRAKWKDASSIQTCARSQRNFSSVLKKVSEKSFK